jgi:hypothetical protein
MLQLYHSLWAWTCLLLFICTKFVELIYVKQYFRSSRRKHFSLWITELNDVASQMRNRTQSLWVAIAALGNGEPSHIYKSRSLHNFRNLTYSRAYFYFRLLYVCLFCVWNFFDMASSQDNGVDRYAYIRKLINFIFNIRWESNSPYWHPVEHTGLLFLKDFYLKCFQKILSRVGWYAWREWRVLVRMIGFNNSMATTSFTCT